MVGKLPTKPPGKNSGTFDRFRPEMPNIPGVGQAPKPAAGGVDAGKMARILGAAAGAMVLMLAVAWWVKNIRHSTSHADVPKPAETSAPVAAAAPLLDARVTVDEPTVAAKVEELAKPWTARKFTFVQPVTHQSLRAMVIRLPGGGLWAFALQEPYGQCELELVTDLSRLAKQYGYRAIHPMVASPCDETVYDPLNVSSIGGDVWARGAVVQGAGLRPPTAINVEVRGHSIIADRME